MNLKLKLLEKEDIDFFNKAHDEAFEVQAKYFPGGVLPDRSGGDGDFDLEDMLTNEKFTVLSILDGDKFIGGAIAEDSGSDVTEIVLFFLIVDYQGKNIGKDALHLVESYFRQTKIFRLITPSQVLRNSVFYVNKCNYKIVEVVDFDKELNSADFVFEKRVDF